MPTGTTAVDSVSTAAADLPNLPQAWPSPEDIPADGIGAEASSGGSLRSILPLKADAQPLGLAVRATRTADGTMFSFTPTEALPESPSPRPPATGKPATADEAGPTASTPLRDTTAERRTPVPPGSPAVARSSDEKPTGAITGSSASEVESSNPPPPPSAPSTASLDATRSDAIANKYSTASTGTQRQFEESLSFDSRMEAGEESTDDDFMLIQMVQDDGRAAGAAAEAAPALDSPAAASSAPDTSSPSQEALSNPPAAEGFFKDVDVQQASRAGEQASNTSRQPDATAPSDSVRPVVNTEDAASGRGPRGGWQ